MLVDHIGYILLPEAAFLRYIGRLAMPIFAFFIGEGCLYTRNRKKYFTRIFGLGVVCLRVGREKMRPQERTFLQCRADHPCGARLL